MRLKGTALLAILNYLDTLYGVQRRTDLVLFLPSTERLLLEGGVLASSWYPAESVSAVLEAAAAHFSDPSLPHRAGRHLADFGVRGAALPVLRQGPLRTLQTARQTWGQQCSRGHLDVDVPGEREALLTLEGWEPTRALCARFGGYVERLVELSGGGEVSLDPHACRLDGEPACRWLLGWSPLGPVRGFAPR